MVKSAYIHIPFCKSKCHYCSFISFCNLDLKQDYLKTLTDEIKYFYEGEFLKTLYIGGGTPSLLEPSEIENLIRLFNTDNSTEITIEVNPESCNYEFFQRLYQIGINRISLGCQTFDDTILKQINRRHNSKQVIENVKNAQKAGFKNISLDFIYGLPNQTIEGFLSDLDTAINLGIQHISLYGLKIDEGCHFYSYPPENLPNEDSQADMYLAAVEFLKNKNFYQYEVSNFSLEGFNSKHNTTYWENEEYYGFGVAAHGYKNKIRYANLDNIEKYLADFTQKNDSKQLSKKEILEEEIFLGLRKTKGINIKDINKKFDINFNEKYEKILNKYLNLNLMQKTETGYKLTLQGILVSNVVLADFIEE